jgi:hypothetical protein
MSADRHLRGSLPIPDRPVTSPTTYDAKDPDTRFRPWELLGYESGTTVSPDYTAATSRFTGKIHWVQLDVGTDDNDHFIDPEERLRVAMARQ